MKHGAWAAVAVAAMVVSVVRPNTSAAQALPADGHEPACSEATIAGDYGVQGTGTQQLPDGRIESWIGITLKNYDGAGNVTNLENVKGSIRGLATDRRSVGTYKVNADCTGSTRFEPVPGIIVEGRFVIVDDGNEIRSLSAAPPGAMVAGVEKRVRRR